MSPAGFFAVVAMPVIGFMLGRKTDAQWLIGVGLLLMAISIYWMSQMNLFISPGQVVWPRVVLILGLSICFAPANVAAYLYTPTALRGAAVGLLSLLRNEGGSVGTSLAQTVQERRDQFHTLRLGEYLDPFNRQYNPSLSRRKRVSCSRPAIRLPRSSWRGRRSRLCASNRHPRWPISMSFGCRPR
jgi:MFS transporter, DHA2 family, multidrug resistance protein